MRESHVVSKTFDVDQLDQDHLSPQEDGLDFVNDIPAEMVGTFYPVLFAAPAY